MVDERSVAVAKIGPSRFQGRGSSGSDIPDLAKSIKTNGLINPIHVWETEAGLELVCGARRLEAHRLLGREEILAKVHSGIGTTEAASLHWSDNLEREDLGYYEQAVTAGRILGWTDGPAAAVDRKAFLEMTGLSSARLKRLQQLHRLSPEVGAHVDSGALTQTEGIEISRLPQGDQQNDLAKEYLARISAENPESPSRDLVFLKEAVAARLPQKPKAEAGTGARVLADEIGADAQPSSGESAGTKPRPEPGAPPPEGGAGEMPDDDAGAPQREKKRPGTETVEYGECHDRIRLVMTPKDWIVTAKIPRGSSDSQPTQDIKRAFEKPGDDRGGLHLLLAYMDAAGKMAREKAEGADGQE